MNRAQQATLLVVLAIDLLLVLFPPFERRVGWRALDLGYHSLPFWLLDHHSASINFPTLAAEIAVVTVIGLTIFVLMRR